jgi:TatD DNase family protein
MTASALIDTHLHLDMLAEKTDVEALLQRAKANQIVQMISIGCGLESSQKALAYAEAHDAVFATTGIHPHQASKVDDDEWSAMQELLSHPKMVGVGETGLDYFYNYSTPEDQQRRFRENIRVALEHDLPFIVHSRDAEEDTLQILEEERSGQPLKGVIHCFSGTLPFAERCLEMGLYLSMPGIITFAKSLQKVVKKLPLDRMLVETDSPFLAPTPHRGKINEPAFVRNTTEKLAKLLKRPVEEVCEITTQNARNLFSLPTP